MCAYILFSTIQFYLETAESIKGKLGGDVKVNASLTERSINLWFTERLKTVQTAVKFSLTFCHGGITPNENRGANIMVLQPAL